MKFTSSLLTVALLAASGTLACPGLDHDHGLAPRSQRSATQPSGGTSLIRPLTWGQVNVVSTTDIHGWYLGHLKSSQPEPNFSGDFGDFASFVAHMRAEAKRRHVDLLIVDSGDLHDGNGLTDGVPPNEVAGHRANEFHSRIKYDALAVGNHELYNYTIAKDTYDNFRPAQNGRYLASNVNITINNQSVPMGERYVKYTTALGRKVTSMGVLYEFTGQDKGLTVQKIADMVKEPWFAEALSTEPDFFLLPGHMPVRQDKWPVVVSAIRAKYPYTPILILGGHTHIRDCTTYDAYSVGLESGRYLETIGWLAVNSTAFDKPKKGGHPAPPSPPAGPPGKGPGPKKGPAPPAGGPAPGGNKPAPPAPSSNMSAPAPANISISRTYIDANRRNYAFHSGLTLNKFDTAVGTKLTSDMASLANQYNLSKSFGTAPQDYYLSRVGINDEHSLLNLLTYKVLPTVISTSNPDRAGKASIVLANSGSQRFDVYAGDFTKSDEYIVSPFLDAFLYIKDVQYQYAQQIVGKLNNAGASRRRSESPFHQKLSRAGEEDEAERYGRGEVEHIFQEWRREQFVASTSNVAARKDLEELDARADAQATLGYVTTDQCPGQGDDTVHTAIPYASQPAYVQSPPAGNSTAVSGTDNVDVVFLDFIESNVLSILNGLQTQKNYTTTDVSKYNSYTTQDLYPLYAAKAWN